jgi:HK97 family phage prohead protease
VKIIKNKKSKMENKNKINNKDFERRTFDVKAETRADEQDGKKYIEGHAALFNEKTWIGDFREYISPDAFSDVLEDDTRVLFNHDPSQILARTTNKTAEIKQDSKGLHFRFEVPNTTLGNDLYELVNSGIINQSSFGFTIKDEKWEKDAEGTIREIIKIGRLYDVSPVSFPAYEQTDLSVAQRKYNFFVEKENNKEEEEDLVKRSLVNLRIKLATINK